MILLDKEDEYLLEKYRWSLNNRGYAQARVNGQTITLHRLLMGNPKGLEIDHRNLDKLDNRKNNLRTCTHSENSRNRKVKSNSKTGYKGIHKEKNSDKWRVRINRKHIGYFNELNHAIDAYNKAVREFYGEFAYVQPRRPI